MKKFAYKAMDPTGRPVEGQLEVGGQSEVDQYFLDKNLVPLNVKELKAAQTLSFFRRLSFYFRHKLFESELIAFTRQFAAAYGAGLAVPRILSMLTKQLTHEPFRDSVGAITGSIERGKGLTESFAQFTRFFDATYLAMLGTGEMSGNLDKVMDYAAGLLEKKMIHRERIKSTMLYPKLVVGAIVFTIIIMLIFVIPQFQKLYERFGSDLPLPTRILVSLSQVVQVYWWLIPVSIVPGYFAVKYMQSNARIMLWVHEKMLRSPIFGPLFIKVELTHFCTTFALLLRSGIKVTDATEISIRGMRNSYLRHKMSDIVPFLEQGGTVSGAMERVDVIPPLMSSMVAVGEESGALETLLERVAYLYENETEMMLKRLPTLLEPIILSILFALTLGLAIAIYLPMWRLSSLVKGG